MTQNKDYRKNFMDTMLFKSTNCVPFHEIGLWLQTVERWIREGYPKEFATYDYLNGDPYFGFEPKEYIHVNARSNIPAHEHRVLEEDDQHITYVDHSGIVRKALKEGSIGNARMSMDQYLQFPVWDRDSFHKWKKRFQADIKTRYPEDWDMLVDRWKHRNYPLCLLSNGQFGFYSMLRNWVGTEGISYMFYDDPELVHEMLEFLADYFIELTKKALNEVEIDYFSFFEDMAFKNGPLISPEIFRKFFMKHYVRVIDHLKKHGINLIIIDTDGNPVKLIPLYLECGINGIWPVEVAAGIDPIILRKEFGNDLAMTGGIDKRILFRSEKEIKAEILRILDYMLPRGGYIPTIDHAVSPDASYKNFLYYLKVKKEVIEDNNNK